MFHNYKQWPFDLVQRSWGIPLLTYHVTFLAKLINSSSFFSTKLTKIYIILVVFSKLQIPHVQETAGKKTTNCSLKCLVKNIYKCAWSTRKVLYMWYYLIKRLIIKKQLNYNDLSKKNILQILLTYLHHDYK